MIASLPLNLCSHKSCRDPNRYCRGADRQRHVQLASFSRYLAIGLGKFLSSFGGHDDKALSRAPDDDTHLVVRQTNLLADNAVF